MGTGASALKIATKNTNVDDVDEVMDELAELGDEQEAINEALGQPLQDFDDDELLAELDDLDDQEAKMLEAELPDVDLDLPSAPTNKLRPKKVENKEEKELAELDALLA